MQSLLESKRELKVSDRCDSCSAQAFVIAEFISGELLFCGHHYNKFSEKISKSALNVIDKRSLINAKP